MPGLITFSYEGAQLEFIFIPITHKPKTNLDTRQSRSKQRIRQMARALSLTRRLLFKYSIEFENNICNIIK